MSYFSLVENQGRRTLTTLVDGEPMVADSTHPNFDAIVSAALAGEPITAEMFDVGVAITNMFESLSDRVSVRGDDVFIDGDRTDNALTRTILRFLREGEDAQPLVNFLEKLLTNPSQESREQLFEWLRRHDFTIAEDGNFLAYKALDVDGNSISSGTAIVDGEVITGKIPNRVGSVIEMPRSEVADRRDVACSTGLHAGNWRYVEWFGRSGGMKVRVSINPRDVVSVPSDSHSEKLRVCRYTVLDIVEEADESLVYREPDAEDIEVEEPVKWDDRIPEGTDTTDFPGFDEAEIVWHVEGEQGSYLLYRSKSGWGCTCPSFRFDKGPNGEQCKHLSGHRYYMGSGKSNLLKSIFD